MSMSSMHFNDPFHKQAPCIISEVSKVKNGATTAIIAYRPQDQNHFGPASTIIRDAPLVKDTKDRIFKLKDWNTVPNTQVVSNMLRRLVRLGTIVEFWWEKRMIMLLEEATYSEQRNRRQRNIDKYLEAYPWRKPHFGSDQRWLVVSRTERNTTSFTLKLITEETDNGREH